MADMKETITTDNAHRAAVVMLHLTESAAEEVFKNLTPVEMRLLSKASREVAQFPVETVQQILGEFMEEMEAGHPELKGGADYVNRLAVKTLGAEKAREMIEESDFVVGLPDTLAEVDAKTLANLMGKEHPQTIALILAHIEPQRASEVITALPDSQQFEILRRLGSLETVSPEVVRLVEDTLIGEIQLMGKGATRKIGGIQVVADVLNQMEKSHSETLMEQMEDADAELAEEVRSRMFVFEDLLHVDKRGMQTLLKHIDRDTLVVALKAADSEMKEHVFENLSKRAVDMILEDMEAKGAVRLSEVEAAQAEIVRIALPLAQSGAIEINKGGSDVLVG